MREAMASAPVGDDVLGDDPTVQELEKETATLLGKEAALYTPSGTMANQLALRCHAQPGDEILLEGEAHIYYYESGGPAALSGVMCRCLSGQRGVFTAADVEAVLRPSDPHFAPTRLVCIENTHNRGGGKVWTLQAVQDVAVVARKHKLMFHLDGARLWNACAATGVTEREYAACFDTVSVCFSKGLGAPVGSALAGPRELVQRARRFRKMFGGGMRQAGIVAAGALYALRNHRSRLTEDHANARMLAEGLTGVRQIDINPAEVETNMVRFRLNGMPAGEFIEKLKAQGVLMLATGPSTVRAVTNLMCSTDDIRRAVDMIRKVF